MVVKWALFQMFCKLQGCSAKCRLQCIVTFSVKKHLPGKMKGNERIVYLTLGHCRLKISSHRTGELAPDRWKAQDSSRQIYCYSMFPTGVATPINRLTTVPVLGCRTDSKGSIQDRYRGESICDGLSEGFKCHGGVITGRPISLIGSAQSFHSYPERSKVDGRKACLTERYALRKCEGMKR